MKRIDIPVIFKELERDNLHKFLKELEPLRLKFWKEMNKTEGYLEDFEDRTFKAFCILCNYGYLLGRYDSILLPEISSRHADSTVSIGLISELFVLKEYRKCGTGKSLINSVQELVGKRYNLPLILGCDKSLNTFYKLCNFLPIQNYQSSDTTLMLWCPYLGSISERFEKLFMSPNKN